MTSSWPARDRLVRLLALPKSTITVDGRARMITIPPRADGSSYYKALARFDKTREHAAKGEREGGIMSQRGEHYSTPEITADMARYIKGVRGWLRQYGASAEAQPHDSVDIPLKADREGEIDWKPFTVEFYGPSIFSPADKHSRCTRVDLERLAMDAWQYNRLLKIAQVHGALHSVAMVTILVEQGLPFDFVFHNDVPNEMPDELEFVKYIVLHELKLPLIMTRLHDTTEEYMFNKKMLMSDRARWCTNEWKIRPFKKLLRKFFFNSQAMPATAKYVDVLQYLGIQAFQSPGRASMNPLPTPNMMSVPTEASWESQRNTNHRLLRVYDTLPVFNLSHEDDIALSNRRGWMRNPNELEYGRHGCLLCPYASIPFYIQLKRDYPDLFAICKRRVFEGNLRGKSSYTFIPPLKPGSQYRQPPWNLTEPPI